MINGESVSGANFEGSTYKDAEGRHAPYPPPTHFGGLLSTMHRAFCGKRG
jgi:hypothetical protein